MSKFSVKKPFTVLVGVVIVLVLGLVSFLRMTPDLLPNMDLPYVLIITVWPGATPEKVETAVTKPLEQSMATLDRIDTVSSTSGENSSTLFLEFQQGVNMDTVTVDILQNISQIEGSWDDAVGTPIILKINPDMMPLMVTAVEMDGMGTVELSTFADETLLNKLESITGVASVSATGIVESQINVVLDQKKINKQNKRLQAALGSQFDDAEAQLRDAQNQLQAGASAGGSLPDMSGGMPTVDTSGLQADITDAILQIRAQIEEAEGQLEQLESTKEMLEGLKQSVTDLEATQKALEEQAAKLPAIDEKTSPLAAQLLLLDQQNAAFDEMFKSMKEAEVETFKASDASYLAMMQGYADLQAAVAALGIDYAEFVTAVAVNQQLQAVNASLDALDQTLAQLGMARKDIGPALDSIVADITALQNSTPQLYTLLSELEAGAISATNALADAANQITSGIGALAETTMSMMSAQAQLTLSLAQAQLNDKMAQLTDAKSQALDSADLKGILTMDMVSNILKAENFSMPAGYVQKDGTDYLVRVGDEFTNPEELQNLLLFDPGIKGVAPIYLKDVADVYVSDNSDSIFAKINGDDGILLSFMKQSTYATADVSDNINERFVQLEEEYPGLHFVNLMDQGDYIHLVIDSILENLILGAIFAIIILFLFLWDLRPTFITLCSIPISVLFAIVLMYFSGVTINILSLSGLAVAVGMLVDNSIVVIENVFRLRNRGESATRAAISGATQVAGAIVASTLTTICVFLPIVFVQGITRELFTDMALTLAYSLIASLIVALTLVPAMSSTMLRRAKPHKGRVMAGMLRFYQRTARWTLSHKAPVLIASVVLLAASVGLVLLRGFEFMPEADSPEIMVTMQLPDETPFDEVKEAADTASARVQQMDGVATVGTMLSGSDGMMGAIMGMGSFSASEDARSVSMYVKMEPGQSAKGNAVVEAINGDLFTDLGVESASASGSSSMTGYMDTLGGSGITINVYGENQEQLMAGARQVAQALRGIEGAINVDDGIGETEPELRFIVDKNKAAAKGLTVAQVFMEVSEALTTKSTATTVSYDENSYSVNIVNPNDEKLTPGFIRGYSFEYTDMAGATQRVALSDIATVEETETTRSISRLDQRRYLTVNAEVDSDSNVTLVTNAAERALQEEALPTGVSYEFSGENETIMDAIYDLLKMLLLGILLVYLIMVAQFQSLKSPFIVMFTLPLAFTGGMLALLLTGKVLSVVALIGFVMLCGIIVNNGIVLIDYVNQLRAEGAERREALLEAGSTRMRPILMTSLTTILGLSVMALGVGEGSEMMQPIAIVCIGGLVYATIMTLYVIPILYDIFNKKPPRVVSEEDLKLVED